MHNFQTYKMHLLKKRNQIQNKLGLNTLAETPHKNIKKYLFLFGIIIFLTACVANLTEDKIASIQSVCINPIIQKPKSINFYFQKRASLNFIIEETLKHQKMQWKLERVYKSSGSSIDLILKEQFETELKNSNIFNSVVSTEGDAEFRFQINGYGFNENFFDGKMTPKLWIEATLVTTDELVLWNYIDFCCGFREVQALYKSELYNPALMIQSLASAAKASSIMFIEDMKKDLERK